MCVLLQVVIQEGKWRGDYGKWLICSNMSQVMRLFKKPATQYRSMPQTINKDRRILWIHPQANLH